MTFREALENGAQSVVNYLFVFLAGGMIWLVRRIFTNQIQIKELKTSQEHRDAERKRDQDEFRSAFKRIEESQKEMRDDIRNLSRR
jgi:uncharacterized membrane protein (DUF106 family)